MNDTRKKDLFKIVFQKTLVFSNMCLFLSAGTENPEEKGAEAKGSSSYDKDVDNPTEDLSGFNVTKKENDGNIDIEDFEDDNLDDIQNQIYSSANISEEKLLFLDETGNSSEPLSSNFIPILVQIITSNYFIINENFKKKIKDYKDLSNKETIVSILQDNKKEISKILKAFYKIHDIISSDPQYITLIKGNLGAIEFFVINNIKSFSKNSNIINEINERFGADKKKETEETPLFSKDNTVAGYEELILTGIFPILLYQLNKYNDVLQGKADIKSVNKEINNIRRERAMEEFNKINLSNEYQSFYFVVEAYKNMSSSSLEVNKYLEQGEKGKITEFILLYKIGKIILEKLEKNLIEYINNNSNYIPRSSFSDVYDSLATIYNYLRISKSSREIFSKYFLEATNRAHDILFVATARSELAVKDFMFFLEKTNYDFRVADELICIYGESVLRNMKKNKSFIQNEQFYLQKMGNLALLQKISEFIENKKSEKNIKISNIINDYINSQPQDSIIRNLKIVLYSKKSLRDRINYYINILIPDSYEEKKDLYPLAACFENNSVEDHVIEVIAPPMFVRNFLESINKKKLLSIISSFEKNESIAELADQTEDYISSMLNNEFLKLFVDAKNLIVGFKEKLDTAIEARKEKIENIDLSGLIYFSQEIAKKISFFSSLVSVENKKDFYEITLKCQEQIQIEILNIISSREKTTNLEKKEKIIAILNQGLDSIEKIIEKDSLQKYNEKKTEIMNDFSEEVIDVIEQMSLYNTEVLEIFDEMFEYLNESTINNIINILIQLNDFIDYVYEGIRLNINSLISSDKDIKNILLNIVKANNNNLTAPLYLKGNDILNQICFDENKFSVILEAALSLIKKKNKQRIKL